MRKHLLLAVLLTCTGLKAQSLFFPTEKSHEKIRFGVQAGLNSSFLTYSSTAENTSVHMDSHIGFHAGVTIDIPVWECLHMRSGLFYTQKGFKLRFNGMLEVSDGIDYIGWVNPEIKNTPSYIELPVLVSLHGKVGKKTDWLLNAGPYFAYGLGGKSKAVGGQWIDSRSPEIKIYEIDWSKLETNYFSSTVAKRFDMGLQVGTSILVSNHFEVGVAYQFGLVNVSNDSEDTIHNRNLMITLGYWL